MNTIQEEIEELKKDREKKSKQIDALLRAQARLNSQLADLRPLSALTAAARRDADPRPSAAELDSDARMARAMEVVRRRRQAQLNAQPISENISENIPERPPNPVSITARTPLQYHATSVVPSRPLSPAAILSSGNEELAQINAELATFRRARQAAHLAREQVSIAEEVGRLSIARSRRMRAATGVIDPDPDNIVRPTQPIELPDQRSTLRLSDTRSRLPPRDPDSDIQPPSTASMPSSSEVSETMATQGSTTSSSLPVNTSGVGTSNPSDLVTTTDSMSGGSSSQSTNEIAITGSVARLDTSVSSSIVPGDSISNFRLPALADNRAGAITSHGFDGPSRLSEARRNEVENLATSLNLSRDSITTNYHVALDAPGTTRATAIEIDSDPEDDLDSILDMPMFRPGAFGDMHRAVSQLVERADRMERALEA
jgi:hypothetical protein